MADSSLLTVADVLAALTDMKAKTLELPPGPIAPARVGVRAIELHDLPTLALLANDERIAINLRDRFPAPYTLTHAAEFYVNRQQVLAKGDKSTPEGLAVLWSITVDDVYVGGVGMHPDVAERRCVAEMGYWLGLPYWGHGISQIAAQKLIDHTFETSPDIVRIEANVFHT